VRCPRNRVNSTHHTYNGAHSYTTVVMKLAGHWRNFRIVERRHFDVFAESFGRFRGALKQAAETGNQRFVDRFDVFADSRRSVPPRVSFGFLAPLMAAALGGLLGYGVYAGAAAPNAALAYHQAVPYTAAPAPTDAASGRRRQVAPAPSEPRKDHLEAHLGKATPTAAGYIAGERRLRTNGLSTVTVDNGQNGADVLVKLVTLDAEPSYPVRVFYIPAHGSFTVKDVAPGRYDVRYLERWSGEMARSDPFTLSQTQRGGGIEYDQMTLTLYKVQNGNMQTHTINESEF
jgi:hypothetical protein